MLGCATVMNLHAPHLPHPRAALPAALLAATLLAGCGSSASSESIGVGHESTANNALIEHTTTPTTPTSGPLSKEPTIAVPKTPPPKTLTTKDLIVGTGSEAKTGDPVAVNYVGALYSNGHVFDASWKRGEPFDLTLGQGQVIPGWEKGIVGMRVGGRRELIIPPELAYGKAGHPPTIPANSTLIFIVDLLST
jgi:FKBP-type peptidyl-prolyl cis-trans isomerase